MPLEHQRSVGRLPDRPGSREKPWLSPSAWACRVVQVKVVSPLRGRRIELSAIPATDVSPNHLDNTRRIPGQCGTLSAAAPSFPFDSWGISVADAYRVKAQHPAKSFDRHRVHSIPLHCLLCSVGSGDRPSPDAAEEALRELRFMTRVRNPAWPRRADGVDAAIRDAAPLPEPRTELPEMFRRALEVAQRADEEGRAEGVDELANAYPRIAGVVVLTDPKRPVSRSRQRRLSS